MDLEKLTKSQIVLLTLLVSFVTSIASGIVTVSLMEQAPPTITQTVNRIVERTVEKVAPSTQAAAVAVATPETVVVRESELITRAIENISPSVVRLFMPGVDEAGKEIQLFVGLALVTDESGVLLADVGTPDGKLTAIRSDGIEVPASVIERPKEANMIRLQAATTSENEQLSWRPVSFATELPGLGATVVTIAGRTAPRVAQGIVIAVPGTDVKEGEAKIVETNIGGEQFAAGSPLITAEGAVIGVATRQSRSAAGGGFLASSGILLQNANTEEKAAQESQ